MGNDIQAQIASVSAYLQGCTPPEPRYGAAPRPVFRPDQWRYDRNHCLIYAAHVLRDRQEWRVPYWGMEAPNPGTCCGIFNKLVTMGFKPAPCSPENRLPREVEGYYLTALFTGAQSDIGFHLFKCDGKNNPGKRRGWSELLPGLLPRNRDDFGKAILDPRTAKYFEGSMTPHFISFFHVPNEGMDRDAAHRMVPKSALNLQNPPLQPSVL